MHAYIMMMVMDRSVKHPTRAGGNIQKFGGNSSRRSGQHRLVSPEAKSNKTNNKTKNMVIYTDLPIATQ